jgi:putative spermidine/putrescine transport system permease protein
MSSTRSPSYGLLSLFVLLTLVPVVLGVGYALLYSLGLIGIISQGFTLNSWTEVLFGAEFWNTLLFSIWVAGASIGLAVALALFMVVRFARRLSTASMNFLLYLPLSIPAIVMAFLGFQLLSKSGFFSRIFYQMGALPEMEAFPDLINDQWGIGIIVCHVCMASPFFTILLHRIYINERVSDLERLAGTLGANSRAIFRKVTLPVLWRKALPTIALYFVFALGSYEIPLLLGSQSKEMISVHIIRKLQKYNLMDIPEAYAVSVLYTLFVVAFVWTMLRTRKSKTA